jgi:hypothetical protein
VPSTTAAAADAGNAAVKLSEFSIGVLKAHEAQSRSAGSGGNGHQSHLPMNGHHHAHQQQQQQQEVELPNLHGLSLASIVIQVCFVTLDLPSLCLTQNKWCYVHDSFASGGCLIKLCTTSWATFLASQRAATKHVIHVSYRAGHHGITAIGPVTSFRRWNHPACLACQMVLCQLLPVGPMNQWIVCNEMRPDN